MLRRECIFLNKSVVFWSKNNQHFQNVSDKKKKIVLAKLKIKFFPPTRHKNLCRDPSPIEYTENGLTGIALFSSNPATFCAVQL